MLSSADVNPIVRGGNKIKSAWNSSQASGERLSEVANAVSGSYYKDLERYFYRHRCGSIRTGQRNILSVCTGEKLVTGTHLTVSGRLANV